MPEIALPGCSPEPLMSYLKALGVLRLVSEQKDSEARGSWNNDVFWLRSPVLFRQEQTDEEKRTCLLKFFLEDYRPTPIMAPWGARSGFFPTSSENTAREALAAIVATDSPRLEQFRFAILFVRNLLAELKLDHKAKDDEKLKLLEVCRSRFPDDLLDWLDACYVLTSQDRKFPPLLGTGGNEGSGSYVSGFAQQVVECLVKRRQDVALETALFGMAAAPVACDQSPGHFAPGAASGPNSGQGFDGPLRTNAWDYLLCLEGACVWASAAVRRLGKPGRSMAAFPFTVNVTGAGDPGITFVDQLRPKQAKRNIAEMWLPLWNGPTTCRELRSLISEGRATTGGRNAETGIDLARAAVTLGVDRGIDAFQRTVFVMRNGQSFLGISLGRFEIRERSEVDLLREVDPWLDSFGLAARDRKAPPRFKAALTSIDQATFDLCRYGGRMHLQSVLVALGRTERELAVTQGKVGQSRIMVRPLVGLSAEWAAQADSGTEEFAIARALAAIRDNQFKVGPLRTNLEPVVVRRKSSGEWHANWADKDRTVVWSGADLTANLASVLQRRLMDGARVGSDCPPLASPFTVSLSTVAAFLSGEVDDQGIEKLIWGLMLIHDRGHHSHTARRADDAMVPRTYALLKLLFLPRPLVMERPDDGAPFARLLRENEPGGLVIRPEPAILHLLRGRRLGEACAIAMRRLRASGLNPMPGPIRNRGVRDAAWRELDDMGGPTIDPQRLAAALLIPISGDALGRLVRLVIRGYQTGHDDAESGSATLLEGDMQS